METLEAVGAWFLAAGITPARVVACLGLGFFFYGVIHTRQFSSALILGLSLVSPATRSYRQGLLARRILTTARRDEILTIELVNFATNLGLLVIFTGSLLGLQLLEVKTGLRDTLSIGFPNASGFLLEIADDFGRLFKLGSSLAVAFLLYKIFEDAAVIRTAMNVRYRGRPYLKEHRARFHPFGRAVLPRYWILLFGLILLGGLLLLR